eukprot:CAMPEP_0175101030 /NCGR_PEP_ID=MMETSP0086_2-20121207/7516_1 /TAXON_ID=136419 /ORGANISM="Unknown Unknown, Strain D1" /LENGTH=120 /DNA_ID=CAMNT_0016375407 /DNA_START=30 /DNA_END=392 /DNA_ORIENTATION=+
MSGGVTKEDEAQLIELKNQQASTQRSLIQARGGLDAKKKLQKRSELTLKECHALPNETVTYKAVGRMFLKASLPKIKEDIKDIIIKAETDIASLEKQTTHLEKTLEQQQAAMRELISGKA